MPFVEWGLFYTRYSVLGTDYFAHGTWQAGRFVYLASEITFKGYLIYCRTATNVSNFLRLLRFELDSVIRFAIIGQLAYHTGSLIAAIAKQRIAAVQILNLSIRMDTIGIAIGLDCFPASTLRIKVFSFIEIGEEK